MQTQVKTMMQTLNLEEHVDVFVLYMYMYTYVNITSINII